MGDYAMAIEADKGTPAYCALLARLLIGDLDPDGMRRVEDETPHAAARMAIGAYRLAFDGKVDGDAGAAGRRCGPRASTIPKAGICRRSAWRDSPTRRRALDAADAGG